MIEIIETDKTELKQCTKCKVLKPLTEFHWAKLGVARLSECKECKNTYNREYTRRTANSERHRAMRKVRRQRYHSTLNGRIKSVLYRAQQDPRGHFVDLTPDEALAIWHEQSGNCAISGLPMDLHENSRKTASLDRIDSSKGYTKSNVQWVCRIVNVMKYDMPLDEFLGWCHAVKDYNTTRTTYH